MPPGPVIPPVSALLVVYGLFLLASILGAWIWAIIRLALGLSVVPRFTPRVVPWRGAVVLLVVTLWLAVQTLGPAVYLWLRGAGGPPKGPGAGFQPGDMMIASALENTALLIALPLVMAASSGARPRDFLGEGGDGLRVVRALQGMAAWPLAAPVVYGMMILAVAIWGKEAHPLERAIQAEGLGEHAWVFFLASVALAPMAEELVFRGAILGWLTRVILRGRAARMALESPEGVAASGPSAGEASAAAPAEVATIVLDNGSEADVTVTPLRSNDPGTFNEYAPPAASLDAPDDLTRAEVGPDAVPAWGAVAGRLLVANVLVSALFASLHYAVWPTPVPIFFLSLVLGLLYQRTGSLVAPVALHMTFNGVSTVLMFLALGAMPPAPAGSGGATKTPGASPATPPAAPIPVDDPAPVPKP